MIIDRVGAGYNWSHDLNTDTNCLLTKGSQEPGEGQGSTVLCPLQRME